VLRPSGVAFEVASGMTVVSLAACTLIFVGMVRWSLWQRRREQGLVRLAPGIPRGGAMNVALGRALLLPFLVAWCVALVVPLLLTILVPTRADVARLIAAALLLVLPLAGLTLDDYARMRKPSLASGLAVALGVAAACPLLALLPSFATAVPLAPVAGASLTVTALFVRFRWRRMVAARCPSRRDGSPASLVPG
jgi:hypothetical protein